MPCVDEQTALNFADGLLTGEPAAALRAHIGECETCFELVASCLDLEDAAQKGVPAQDSLPRFEIGAIVGQKYRIQACIGEGAAGAVYRALPVAGTPDDAVALKVYRATALSSAAALRGIARELEIGRALSGEHVCRVLDSGAIADRPYLVLELAERSLRDELEHGSAQRTLARRLLDGQAVAGSLAAVHRAGLLHRDLKPENVLRMPDGRLVLSDFGLARPAASAAEENPQHTLGVGTPVYMAPEQRNAPASRASDIYAFGVLLHELAFGRRPPRSNSTDARLEPMTAAERELLKLCDVCLAAAPERRPNADTVLRRLRRIERLTAAPKGPTLLVAAGVGTLVAVAVVLVIDHRPPPSPAVRPALAPAPLVQSFPQTPRVVATDASSAPVQAARPKASTSSIQEANTPHQPAAWYAGSRSPGYPIGHLRERYAAIARSIERCYAPYRSSPVDHHYASWSAALDGSGAVMAVEPLDEPARAISKLNACVSGAVRRELRLGPPSPPEPVTIELYVGAPWPPNAR